MKILFKNARILNLENNNGYINGCVVVDDDIISYVGNNAPNCKYDRVIDVKNNILMPGFVNAHSHTAMSILRGVKDDVPLQEWLMDGVVVIEEKFTDQDVYWGQMLGMAEYARNGITSFEENYFLYEGLTKAISKAKYRVRIGVGPRIDDKNNSDYIKNLSDANEIILKNTNPKLVNRVVYAHSVYTISEDNFYSMLEFAKNEDLPLSIHLSETLKEVGDCTEKNNGLTPPAYLESLGYFDRKCLCYHCVHMDKDDLQILSDYDVGVVTCPSSNIKLASGIAPIYAMQNKGLNIAIGTDGAASNNSLDMFKEMFLVATLSKVSLYDASVVSARDVLKMATENGAKALGFNSGKIEVGKNADIILINTNSPHMQPDENIISNLVYSANGSDVYLTMI
ncbi:MAG: amidohydrolase, partial [Clostridia bacterium]|nr:amidohydrolase [Clostridia bacterium]